MEYDKKTIEIPEGYEIDIEETKKQEGVIVLRKQLRPKNWAELLKMYDGKESFWYDPSLDDDVIKGEVDACIGLGEFIDEETARAFVALWKLLSYKKAWIGKWEPDWTDKKQIKFVILRRENEIKKIKCWFISRSMSFPTKEMCDEFYESFKDLLEVAKPLL